MNYLRKCKFGSKVYQNSMKKQIEEMLLEIKEAGTFKVERQILSKQSALIESQNKEVLNFCANNYLGLSSHPEVIKAARNYLESHGFGMSSVRFICGTQNIHKELENKISEFYNKDDAILYSSCFDANTGFFETVFDKQDAIISDSLNHASIIDGIRLAKSVKHRYNHLDMVDLEEKLKQSQEQRHRLIVTDGVFSMDGDIAPLDKIVNLAQKYNAMVFLDESHAAGFIGPTGRGTAELYGVEKEIDIITGTLGKAFGGASGGYTVGNSEIISLLRQKSRPYLFSNSLAPPIVGASISIFDIIKNNSHFRQNLLNNTRLFRTQMTQLGFTILGHPDCPIAPVYLGDARLAQQISEAMMKLNVYVIGFSFPVVPKGQARIRVQLSAAHTQEQVQQAVYAFQKVGKEFKVIQ